ncbi:MAG: hypothetical protein M3R03_04615 [Pseudomonadota bacterium]|nr:hypothetical protein [Pseudomonadota bacterium]
MATTKGTTPKGTTAKSTTSKSATPKRATSRTTGASATARKPRATTPKKLDDSLVARTGRTIRDRPYTSAAIATGAATVVAAAAAGAFLMSRRDKSFKEASGDLTGKLKDGLANASETVKDGLASATAAVKDLGQRGADYLKSDSALESTETRTQQEIAEEALTLKETGGAKSPLDDLSATEIKTGSVSY